MVRMESKCKEPAQRTMHGSSTVQKYMYMRLTPVGISSSIASVESETSLDKVSFRIHTKLEVYKASRASNVSSSYITVPVSDVPSTVESSHSLHSLCDAMKQRTTAGNVTSVSLYVGASCCMWLVRYCAASRGQGRDVPVCV
jgi:hypothetical protein